MQSDHRPASHSGPRPKFVPFTSGLVTPSTPSNLPCVRGFACCPVRLNWSGSAPELRGLVLMDWERPMGLAVTGGMQRGPQPETERGWNVDFPFWRRHCCAALKSLSAVHRQRCGEQGWWLWWWVGGVDCTHVNKASVLLKWVALITVTGRYSVLYRFLTWGQAIMSKPL